MAGRAEAASDAGVLERYVPLAVWGVVLIVLMLIALKISSYGYLPGGDLRRHVAKAFTDKPYSEIVVMRPSYTIDHSPGWEWLLRWLHRQVGWGKDALVNFSVVALLLGFFLAPLAWLRRPEAWLLALLGLFLARPTLLGHRLSQGRPFLVTEAILIAMLLAWSRADADRPSRWKIMLTCAGFGLSVWMHGAWYLWLLPVAAFFLSGAWRSGLWLAGCWLAGTGIGAVLTGHPLNLLATALSTASAIFYRENPPQWMLVGELAPDTGDFATLTVLALVFFWSRLRNTGGQATVQGFCLRPVVVLMGMCWVLGFKADRFWADWGIPAALVWMTLLLQEILAEVAGSASLKRLAATAFVAAPLFLDATNDTSRRYTENLSQRFLSTEDASLKGWFPEQNGIFYSTQMDLFYDTFYTNPQGEWRYILGFEPALMPDEDLKIFRRIVWNREAYQAYQPWLDKMKPEDRLVIYSSAPPDLPQLEWINAVPEIWIGRLPRRAPKRE